MNDRQIAPIAQLLQTDENELVTLWVADKIIVAIDEEIKCRNNHEHPNLHHKRKSH
jgi:hypothetical protein